MKHTIRLMALWLAMAITCHAETAPPLRFSGASGWYPIFPAWNKKMTRPALGEDIAVEMSTRLGTTASWLKDIPWARLWFLMDAGELDLVVGAAPNEARRAQYIELESFMTNSYHPYVKMGREFKFEKLADLKDKSVARGIGSKYGDEYETFLKDNAVDVIEIGGGTKENMFPMLDQERMNYIVQNPADAEYWLKQNNMTGRFVYLPKAIWTSEVYIYLSKKSPWAKDAALMRKTLREMKKDGFIARAMTRY